MNSPPFASGLDVRDIKDCEFYHVMDLPGHGTTNGQWDLRGKSGEYLGYFAFAGRRVLEIGPASGFLTLEMEKRGGEIVAVEVPEAHGWDYVPYPETRSPALKISHHDHLSRIKNSFWFNHRLHNSKARLCYADVYDLPPHIGAFDVAVMAAVLLHMRHPLQVVEECAKRAVSLIITDRYWPELEGRPICQLVPHPGNRSLDTWWQFSTQFFLNFLDVLDFKYARVNFHEQIHVSNGIQRLFTIVASKSNQILDNGQQLEPLSNLIHQQLPAESLAADTSPDSCHEGKPSRPKWVVALHKPLHKAVTWFKQ